MGWIFAHMSFVVPVDRLRETGSLLAFWHPRPEYPFHVLLVPKRAISTLMVLSPENDGDFTRDLFTTVQSLVQEHELDAHGYRLIVNGGSYQEVPHLHFHLVSRLSAAHGQKALHTEETS